MTLVPDLDRITHRRARKPSAPCLCDTSPFSTSCFTACARALPRVADTAAARRLHARRGRRPESPDGRCRAASDPTAARTRPPAPSLPPSLPRAGCTMRSNVAEMIIGAGSPFAISMIWPRPPRCSPAPPESRRYSLCQNTSGESVSMISTATLRTPLGNDVTESPSLRRPRAGAAGVEADHVEAASRLSAVSCGRRP